MPSFKSAGKSREDLALVAQLAGLVTAEESAALTRAELVKIIDKENRKTAAAEKKKEKVKAKGSPQKPAASGAPVRRKRKAAETSLAHPDAPAAQPPLVLPEPEASAEKEWGSLVLTTTETIREPAEKVLPKVKSPVGRPRKKVIVPAAEPEPPMLLQPAEPAAAPAAEPAAAPAAELPAVKRRGGRRKSVAADPAGTPALPSANIEMQKGRLAAEPEASDIVAGLAESDAQTAERAPEKSPEAEEAASETPAETSGMDSHRLPPHHTLATSRPERRRIVRDIRPSDSSAQPPSFSSRPGQPASRPGRFPKPRVSMPSDFGARRDLQAESLPADIAAEDMMLAEEQGQLDEPAADAAVQTDAEAQAARSTRPQVETGDLQSGVLEIMPDGYGFLRKENYLQGNKDIYVPPQYIRRFGLRPGDYVTGLVKLQRESDRFQALLYIKEVNGLSPEKMIRRVHFDRLTPIYPDSRFILETVRNELSTRIIDLVAPIGKGQRGMIVSPPKAGKTILLQKIANAISTNNPEVKLIVLLIDERPEEVTDMQRSINGEVVYSTFDKTPENHTKVTELVLERAMRLVELRHDVVILLDSMTRLARAYNLSINPTGRTLSGGLDPGALYGPKRFFGAARNIENGGSLTIIATSLIETGSRMDEVIFEEFKGTGNMEVYLDRKLSEKRIFPAIDINKSGTRREELLMNSKELDAVWTIRKAFSQLDTSAVTEAIINLLLKTKNNEHFISSINVSFNDKNVFDAMRGATKPQDQGQQQQTRSGAATGNGSYGYNTTGSISNYRRPTGYDDD